MTAFVSHTLLNKTVANNNPFAESKKTDQWIQPLLQQEQATMELICFPFAGGGTTTYYSWKSLLSPQINLSAVLLPGREVRIQQAPESDIDKVCDGIISEILAKDPKKPLIFFGHSMGSMLAYEVAIRLQQQYATSLKALIVSGRQAPHVYFGGDFHCSPDDVFIEEIKRFGQTPDIVFEDTEMRNIVLPMLRADYTLLENYRSEASVELSCPLLTCTGQIDTEVTPEQIQSWKELTSGKVEHQTFLGDHFYLTDSASRLQLIHAINDYLVPYAG